MDALNNCRNQSIETKGIYYTISLMTIYMFSGMEAPIMQCGARVGRSLAIE
jgi:hypothetical protein